MNSHRPYILAISGSASTEASNLRILKYVKENLKGKAEVEIYDNLRTLPHFSPDLSIENTPSIISEIREKISIADAVIICTPEYVFSIPSGLKNLLEWCVSTILFSEKPVALITAAASGTKAKEELELIISTLGATFDEKTSILIQSVKAKLDADGKIKDQGTLDDLNVLTTQLMVKIKAIGLQRKL